MSVSKFFIVTWCFLGLLMPGTAFAQAGTCHEPCITPGNTCNAGLVCTGGTCEAPGGADCGTRGNPGYDGGGGTTSSSPGWSVNLNRPDAPQGIFLLEPIGGVEEIPEDAGGGLGVFQFYFNLIYPWIVGMGAGIAVFMGVIGGIQIIQAGADQAGVSNGKNRLLLSLAGLLIILASATVLNALNPTFYR